MVRRPAPRRPVRSQPLQRARYAASSPSGQRHHGGPAAEHGVAGRAARRRPGSRKDSESPVCPGVATTVTSSPATATTSPSVRSPSRAGSERAHRRAGRAPRTGRAPSAWSGWPWVSSVGATRSPRQATWSSTAAQVPLVQRPGSTTTHRCEPGSASTQVFVPSSVIGAGLGASTQVARAVTAPPDQPCPPPPGAAEAVPPTRRPVGLVALIGAGSHG